MSSVVGVDSKKFRPKVSILIPVFNRQKYIGECIESALSQTYKDIEIIIFDNKSTDNTLEICKSYQMRDSRIKIFQNQTNCGPVLNWKKCITEAKGEYSKLLFSDDLLENDCVERMMGPLADPQIGLTYCAAMIGEEKRNSFVSYLRNGDSKISGSYYIDLLLENLAPVSPGAILLRTSDLKKNLHATFPSKIIRDYKSHGAGPDVMISILTSKSYKYVVAVKKPLVFFRAHSESFTVKNKNNEIEDSYISAIAYHLKSNQQHTKWLKYLVFRWVIKAYKNNSVIGIKNYLIQNEGSGRLLEVFIFILLVPFYSLKIFIRAARRKDYRKYLTRKIHQFLNN